jgi:carbamate kinase
MLLVIALGGNALLKRGQEFSASVQRANVRTAARATAQLIHAGHQVVITHGNGPQVGLLELQSYAYSPEKPMPLDILTAETVGMIGYMIAQELTGLLPAHGSVAALLTMIEVNPQDPAFQNPTKPIGPAYDKTEAEKLSKERGWRMMPAGTMHRRAVPSPLPVKVVEQAVIRSLVEKGVTVICAGGGGIPVIRREDHSLEGVEAVIDKDLASATLAHELEADALIMLTDVDGVYQHWGRADQVLIRQASAHDLGQHSFEAGSMGPKVLAARQFVLAGGRFAGIGNLEHALAIVQGSAGTHITA